jgi:glycolate oxidase FAD binding subunit
VILQPKTLNELSDALAEANARAGKIASVDLRAFNRILAHTPEDMTVTVAGGITLGQLQEHLARHNQWLPIDPARADQLTIAGLIDYDLSGPRRCGFGTIRNWLIGMRFALADGTVVSSGGKVVKNVAGYDLMKLMIGGRGTLGVTVEATFKLRPVPEREAFVGTQCESLDEAEKFLGAVIESELTPVIFDLHSSPATPHPSLVLGFSDSREAVEWQLDLARTLGMQQPASLDYESEFWSAAAPVVKVSLLPSKITSALRELGDAPFVARAGNGVIYHRGPSSRPKENAAPGKLMRRVKETFDPNQTLPQWEDASPSPPSRTYLKESLSG